MKRLVLCLLTLALTSCGCANSVNLHIHSYSSEWTFDDEYHWHAATCQHTDMISSKAKHSFSDWIIDEDPGIGEKGSKHRKCTVCPYVEHAEIPALAHEHIADNPVIENNIEPTCTASGSYDEVVYCILCEEEMSRNTIIVPATGHIHTATREGDKKDPTCTEDGYATVITYCTDCGQVVSEDQQTIPATGHDYDDMLFVSAASMEGIVEEVTSCVDDYEIYGYYYCKKCGEYLFDGYKSFPALGHDYEITDSGDATYEAAGYVSYKCTRCGDTYTEETEPKLEHHYSEEWASSTDYHYHACTDEGYEDLLIDKEEHDFESTFTAPTYDVGNNAWVDGTFSRECKICHYVHSWSITKEQYDTNIALGRFPDVSGNTVHYGLYPDNLITDANEIAALDEAKLAAHKYGNEAIFKYNGGYYRRCAAQNTSNGYTGTTSGSYYYFKMNRVRWEIVERYDDGSALLLSKWILDGGTYDDDACQYANSQLHERLSKWKSRSPLDLLFGNDGDMMESARYLMKHTVVNSGDILGADPYYGERYFSDDTEDYLHIPSLGEISKWGQEVDKNLWLTEATSYARAMNSDINSRYNNDFYSYSSYWTRTPQSDAYVKAAYGRMTDPDYGPFYTSFGKPVTDSIGLRYCIRVQLDITKPVNFSHISILALN